MNKLIKLIIIISFLVITYTIPLLSISTAKETVSSIENRTLQAFPETNGLNIFKEKFYSDMNTFLSDHLYGRGFWFKEYSKFSINVLKKDKLQNVVIGKDNVLLRYYVPESVEDKKKDMDENIENTAKVINKLGEFVEKNKGLFCFVGVPYQSTNFESKYPEKYYSRKNIREYKEKKLFSLLSQPTNAMNLNEIFNKYGSKRDDFYYKTDHHWNIKGSYTAYTEILNRIRASYPKVREPYKENDYNVKTVGDTFQGSYGRELNFIYKTDDKIQYYEPKEGLPKYEKYVNGTLDNDLIKNFPSYTAFMGGDLGEMEIRTNRDNLPSILIVGNSYTNSLEYLLFPHFNVTRSLDYRHFNKMSLNEYISKYKPDIVLYVMDDFFYDDFSTMKGMAGDFN